jgi:hypothetical protein
VLVGLFTPPLLMFWKRLPFIVVWWIPENYWSVNRKLTTLTGNSRRCTVRCPFWIFRLLRDRSDTDVAVWYSFYFPSPSNRLPRQLIYAQQQRRWKKLAELRISMVLNALSADDALRFKFCQEPEWFRSLNVTSFKYNWANRLIRLCAGEVWCGCVASRLRV